MRADRLLLELAAKAANANGAHIVETHETYELVDADTDSDWNPLDDDGQSLRLAMRLNLTILPGGRVLLPDAVGFCSPFGIAVGDEEVILAATRRAIVRAAAEIGRQMKEGGAA